MANIAASPTIALASLSIENFRGIRDLSLDFRGPDGLPNRLAVISGPNGCGKTAVLEAALLAVGGSKLTVGPVGRKAIRRGASDYRIQAEFQGESLDPNPLRLVLDSSNSVASDSMPQVRHRFRHWYFSSWRSPSLVGAVDVTVGKAGRRLAKTDANRLLNVKQQLANRAAIERFRPLLSGPYTEIMVSINESWRGFYPDGRTEFFVDIADTPESGGSGAFDVYLGIPGEQRLEVDYLSAGQLELFLFLSALALNEGREGIVIIDEPELHLDPQWHRPILRSLMQLQPQAQFIVATHSPWIYDAAKSYERHFLVPEDDPRAKFWEKAEIAKSRS